MATGFSVMDALNKNSKAANTLTGGKLDSIKSSFSTKLNGALSTVGSVMESIRAKFSEKMESAKTASQMLSTESRDFSILSGHCHI